MTWAGSCTRDILPFHLCLTLNRQNFFLKRENFFSCLRNIVEISFPSIKTQQIGNWLNEITNRLINILLNSCWHFVSTWLFTLLFKVHEGKTVISWMTSSNNLVCHSYALVCHPYLHVCHSYYAIRMYSYATHITLICHSYAIRMYLCIILMLLICHPYMSFACTRILPACHSYVALISIVCHSYATSI